MEKAAKKPGLIAALLIAVAGLACTQLPPLLFVAGGLFGYLLIAGSPLLFLLAVALCAVGAYALAGISGLWLLGLILPAALCLFVMLRRKAAYFDTALAVSALFTVAFYLMLNLPDILAGSTPFYTQQQWVSEIWSEGSAIWAQSSGLGADQLALMQELGRDIAAQLPVYMPAVLCAIGALMGLCNLLLCKRMCRRAAAPIKPMRVFHLWQLPQSFLYGTLTMAAGLLIAPSIGVSAMDAVTAAAFIVALLPFAVQGVSVMWFMQKVRRSSSASLVFLVVVLVLTFPLSVISLGLVGLLEQILHFRRKFLERENSDKQA